MRTAAHSRKCLWEIHTLQDRFAQVCMGWMQAKQHFSGSPGFWVLQKKASNEQRGGGGAKAESIAESLRRLTAFALLFFAIFVAGGGVFFITIIIFYSWALLFSISVNSLILYIWFSFAQQMDLQTLLELKRGGELPGVFCTAPLAHNAIFH